MGWHEGKCSINTGVFTKITIRTDPDRAWLHTSTTWSSRTSILSMRSQEVLHQHGRSSFPWHYPIPSVRQLLNPYDIAIETTLDQLPELNTQDKDKLVQIDNLYHLNEYLQLLHTQQHSTPNPRGWWHWRWRSRISYLYLLHMLLDFCRHWFSYHRHEWHHLVDILQRPAQKTSQFFWISCSFLGFIRHVFWSSCPAITL